MDTMPKETFIQKPIKGTNVKTIVRTNAMKRYVVVSVN